MTFESFTSSVIAPGLFPDLAVGPGRWTGGEAPAAHARRFPAARLAPAAVPRA